MKVLNDLSIQDLKLNKKRSIVIIIGIILSTALICGVAGLVTSFQKTMVDTAKEGQGNYHTIFYNVPKDELKYIITKISSYSLYAFEEEMKQGYITFRGGHRIGLAGQCVMENGRVKILRNISSINIRICKEIIGSSNKIMPYISNFNKVYNTLIVSPPKCGKTTILRDIAKNISNGFSRINLKGKKVAIIDERSEIAGCYNGIPQMNVGIRSDVLDNCLKTNGIIMAIRSLSPEVIICDEIGTMNEVEALSMAFNSGVNMILTVHGIDLDDVSRRKSLKELINDNILERIVVLSS